MIVDDKIMHYVLYKKRTENEVRKKCSMLKYDDTQTEEIISYLREAEYINDNVYIKKYINDVKKLKHMSVNQVKNDLIRRGVDSNLLDSSMIEEELCDFELESAEYLVNKKIKLGEDIEKIKRFLLNKGYSYSNVSKAIDNLENMEDN